MLVLAFPRQLALASLEELRVLRPHEHRHVREEVDLGSGSGSGSGSGQASGQAGSGCLRELVRCQARSRALVRCQAGCQVRCSVRCQVRCRAKARGQRRRQQRVHSGTSTVWVRVGQGQTQKVISSSSFGMIS